MFNPAAFFQYGFSGLCQDIKIISTNSEFIDVMQVECVRVTFSYLGVDYSYLLPSSGTSNVKNYYTFIEETTYPNYIAANLSWSPSYYITGNPAWVLVVSGDTFSFSYYLTTTSDSPSGNTYINGGITEVQNLVITEEIITVPYIRSRFTLDIGGSISNQDLLLVYVGSAQNVDYYEGRNELVVVQVQKDSSLYRFLVINDGNTSSYIANKPISNNWQVYNEDGFSVTNIVTTSGEPIETTVQKDSVINNKSSYLIDTSRLQFNSEQSRWELIESDQVFAYLVSTEKCPFGTYTVNLESDTNLATFAVAIP